MGNVSLWTYSVILLCFSEITFSQHFPFENPSSGYRNDPSKLNFRNILGSKLIQRLADNQNNAPQYEPYPHQMSNPLPCEQMVHSSPSVSQSLPQPPLPPSYSRGVIPYEYHNQRMPVQPPSQSMGSPRHLVSSTSTHAMDPPSPHAIDQPSHLMGPPPQHVSQSNMQENVYTETVTSTCPECEAANQDYSYQEEPCPCCEGGCPCSCEECSCCCKSKGRCPCYSDDPSYPSEKDYSDRDQNYDDYPASDCPCCCCDCAGNHECPCSYDEPQGSSHYRRERPNLRGYSPMKQMNENYMEGSDTQVQRESYRSMMRSSPYKPVPSPRELQQRRYQQFDEPIEPPQYVKMSPRRTFVSQPNMSPPVIHHAPMSELPEESMHRHHMPEPTERIMQHPHIPEMSDRTIHHTEITERAVHRFHEPAPPMPMPPVDSCSMHQENSRVSDWRPVRMPPAGPPRHMLEEQNLHPEPPVPLYRSYQSIPNKYARKYRQPSKPPFFDGLSYTDGC